MLQSHEEQAVLQSETRNQEEINALIENNLRLVLKIANDFLGRGLAWEDLVSEGNRGLVTAAHRFNPERGAKFSTYSAWWIKQAIRQAIAEQPQTIRVPLGTQINARRIRKQVKLLTQELGRIPTNEEVASAAQLPLVTIERLRDTRQVDMQSLNAAISETESDSIEFQDLFSDNSAPPPDLELLKNEDIEQLLKLLENLSLRERMVIRLRFGLGGEAVRTLDQVGAIIDCTNERVRQIQNQALKKLQRRMLQMK